ncbi:MAG: SGNH/GDSL hydrolase family protein [Chitinophagales bacterium]|nr:SGNH/GDSL hydrolase family protein [Chitinophagales bacterium]
MNRKSILVNVLSITIFLVVAEVMCKLILQQVYNRSFDSSLIEDNVYATSSGLKPNAAGRVWGKTFTTDEFRGRKNVSGTTKKRKWLFIGDSITEGVGVDDSATFSSLVSKSEKDFRVLNMSLIGYSLPDYVNVLRYFLQTDTNVERATLFYCLNDVYSAAKSHQLPVMGKTSFVGKVNSFLQKHYSTYKLVKLFAFRNSNSYFRYDAQFYQPGNEHFTEAMTYLKTFDSLCRESKVACEVVLLPYRSQLESGNTEPQKMVTKFCKSNEISCTDVVPHLAKQPQPSSLYLFADEIHFSETGHKAIAYFIQKKEN